MGVVGEGIGEECPWQMEAGQRNSKREPQPQRHHHAAGILETAQPSSIFQNVNI